jgi:hypothetical protein
VLAAMSCVGNADLADRLRQLAAQLSEADPRRVAAYSAARSIAEHPDIIRTDRDARSVPRVGPAILKMLKQLGIQGSRDSADQLYIQGAGSILKKRCVQDRAQMARNACGLDANKRIARDLREIAQRRDDHTRFSLNRAAATVEFWPTELKTLPQLIAIPNVQVYTARLVIESIFRRALTCEEQAFAEGAENQQARLQARCRQAPQK